MSQCAKARGHVEEVPSEVACAQQELITMTRENRSVNEGRQKDKTKLH
jgi:hypothetical protein